MVVDREVNEEVDQVSKEVKEEVPNLPRRGLVVGPAGCAAVHRQPIHPQILIRIVTATTVHCSAPSSTLHCTSLPCSAQCTLHNALHSTKDVLHCVASNSTLCAALLDSLAQQCSADKPEETVAAQQCQLSILQFLPLCIFQSSVFSAVFTKSIFHSWSVTKKSPLPAEILYDCHLFTIFVSKQDLRRKK